MQDGGGAPAEATVTGTPAYMAPEQGRGEAVDARCDLFSLGCVLYRMATGRPPFSGGDVMSVLMSVALDEPPRPLPLNPELPPALAELIERLLSKQPAERPASAQAVVEALREIERARAEAARPRPRRWPWLVACAAAVLGAVGITYWLLPPEMVPEPPPEPGQVAFDFDAADSRLALQHDKDPEQIIDVKISGTLTLPAGDYAVRMVEQRRDRTLMPDFFTVKPGEKAVLPLRLVGEVRKHQLHQRPVRAVALSPVPGSLLALSASDDPNASVLAWDAAHRRRRSAYARQPGRPGLVRRVFRRWQSCGLGRRRQAQAARHAPPGSSVYLWDFVHQRELPPLAGHESWVTSVAFAPDGLHLLSGGLDGNVLLWDLQKNDVQHRLPGHDHARVRSVAFDPDGKQALSCADKLILLWNPANGKLSRTLDKSHTETISAAVFSPDGSRIASAGWDAHVCVRDLRTGIGRLLKGHAGEVHCIAWSADGQRLLSGGHDGTVRLWDADSMAELVCLRGHTKTVTGVAFSADGRYAVSGSADCSVRLWELPK